MKIMLGLWIGLLCLYSSVSSQSSYDSRYIPQQVQYDDEHPSYNSHQSQHYPSSPYQHNHVPQQSPYPSPISSPYPQPLAKSLPHNYYEPETGSYPSPPTYEKEPDPKKEVKIVRPPYPEEESPLYDSENKDISAGASKGEELQYSHDSEHGGHDHHDEGLPSRPQQASLVTRDPKLPLYFTMYEKRVVADPMDKYGKGPWRYMTYGHGITYGSKEPGKVFERGYGYIRALGRDHCKNDKLCPYRDEKPFEYEGRKEPYFGYRPH